ncbi:hypothetical protein MGI18_21335 [Bacillus sp. OVS6]|nr:hypothetical protein MGI18_21335 [Bacillus sp. OVS6]
MRESDSGEQRIPIILLIAAVLQLVACMQASIFSNQQTLVSSRKMQLIQFSLLTSGKTSTESMPGVNSVELQRMVPVPMVEQLSCFLCLSVFDASGWFLQQFQRKQQAAAKHLHFRQMSHSLSCCLTRFLLFSKSECRFQLFMQMVCEETLRWLLRSQAINIPLTPSLVTEDDE